MREETLEELEALLQRKWLLLGIGNTLRGDDAFGPLVARRLAEAGYPALDGGSAPENQTGPIRRAAPDVLILADAAEMEAPIGTLRLVAPDQLAGGSASTHDPGFAMLTMFLRHEMPDLEIVMLAAQPGRLGLDEAMSPEVSAAVEAVVRVVSDSKGS